MEAINARFENLETKWVDYAIKKYGRGFDGAERYLRATTWRFLGGYLLFLVAVVMLSR